MIDITEYIKENCSFLHPARSIERFIPRIYLSTTLRDFIENSESIKPTNKVLPIGVFFNGLAIVSIQSRLTYSFTEEEDKKRYVSDLNDSLEIVPFSYIGARSFLKELNEPDRLVEDLENYSNLYNTMIAYNPEEKLSSIFSFNPHGPSNPESSSSFFGLNMSTFQTN